MTNLVAFTIILPLFTAALMLASWRSAQTQRWLGVLGSLAHLAACISLLAWVSRDGIQTLQVGSWSAPFGITLVCDLFSGIMLAVSALMGFATALYSLSDIDIRRTAFGYYSLLHVLLAGVSGAFLTGDMFNLYVWFEVMLIASFVLIALGGEKLQLEGAIKYVTLSLIASMLLLAGVGMIYGITGSLNMADVAVRLQNFPNTGLITAVAVMFLAAFGIKAAVFPLFFWLPASYHTPPAAVSAIFAGLLTKVGVYALIRMFTLIFTQDVAYTHTILLLVAAATMITGVLGAIAQIDFRRVLSFLIVSHIGYMVMGLALFTPLAMAGAVFYMIHDIVAKTNLFFVSGLAYRLKGTYNLKLLGGLYAGYPWLALLFLIPALALSGVPPLSGFWGKLLLVRAGLESSEYFIVVVALVVGLLSFFAMIRIWSEAFWKGEPATERGFSPPRRGMAWMVAPVVLLAAVTVGIGLLAEPVFGLAQRAGDQLMNPQEYIRAVLR